MVCQIGLGTCTLSAPPLTHQEPSPAVSLICYKAILKNGKRPLDLPVRSLRGNYFNKIEMWQKQEAALLQVLARKTQPKPNNRAARRSNGLQGLSEKQPSSVLPVHRNCTSSLPLGIPLQQAPLCRVERKPDSMKSVGHPVCSIPRWVFREEQNMDVKECLAPTEVFSQCIDELLLLPPAPQPIMPARILQSRDSELAQSAILHITPQ